jgi:hypothetical protein
MKRCAKCGEIKPLIEFVPDKSCKDGRKNLCRVCASNYRLAWYHANKHRPDVKTHRSLLAQRGRAKLKKEILSHYCVGGIIQCADPYHIHTDDVIIDLDLLTLDHVNGDGCKDIRRTNLYQCLKREGYPLGFQVLCWNCQAKKRVLRREYAHIKSV